VTGHPALADRGAVVTGAAGGIGRALAARLVAEGARVVVNDVDADRLATTAREIGAHAVPGDAASPGGVEAVVEAATAELGAIDVWCANAGIDRTTPDPLALPDEEWAAMLEVNVLAHVRAARLLVPRWVDAHATDPDGGAGGRFVVTASAAGLLSMIGAAAYSTTKHAAVGFAEWLSLTYGDRGVTVQAICPQGVRTAMLEQAGALTALLSHDQALAPEAVAGAWVDSLSGPDADRFLVLPHPEVAGYYAARAADTDRWLAGMRRLRAKVDQA